MSPDFGVVLMDAALPIPYSPPLQPFSEVNAARGGGVSGFDLRDINGAQDGSLLEFRPDELTIDDTLLTKVIDAASEVGDGGLDDPGHMPPLDYEDEIVVVGRRLGGTSQHYFYYWMNSSDQPYGPDELTPTPGVRTPTRQFGDPPEVEVLIINPANADAVGAEAEKLQEEIARLTWAIDVLSDFEGVILADGSSMSAMALKELWATLDFKVTDQAFGPGRAGGYDAVTRVSTINYQAVAGWDDSDANGLNFILLHEVIHSSSRGEYVNNFQFDAYMNRRLDDVTRGDHEKMYYDSIEFEETEEFSNVGALALAKVLGVAPHEGYNPTNGYQYGIADDEPERP